MLVFVIQLMVNFRNSWLVKLVVALSDFQVKIAAFIIAEA